VLPLRPFPGTLAVGIDPADPSAAQGWFQGSSRAGQLTSGRGRTARTGDGQRAHRRITIFIPVFSQGRPHLDGRLALRAGKRRGQPHRARVLLRAHRPAAVRAQDLKLTWPRIETPTHYIQLGFDESLDKAMIIAVEQTVDFLTTSKGLDRYEAYSLTARGRRLPREPGRRTSARASTAWCRRASSFIDRIPARKLGVGEDRPGCGPAGKRSNRVRRAGAALARLVLRGWAGGDLHGLRPVRRRPSGGRRRSRGRSSTWRPSAAWPAGSSSPVTKRGDGRQRGVLDLGRAARSTTCSSSSPITPPCRSTGSSGRRSDLLLTHNPPRESRRRPGREGARVGQGSRAADPTRRSRADLGLPLHEQRHECSRADRARR